MEKFLKDVDRGLSAARKYLSSVYFYDERGSRIFQEIMEMPTYYPTRTEFEILTQQALEIGKALNFPGGFNVIELGAGDGFKTLEFLDRLSQGGMNFRYFPVDVSEKAMAELLQRIEAKGRKWEVTPLVGDYFECLRKIESDLPSLFLFLGASIGNYTPAQCHVLLRRLHELMIPEDKLLIGFDLQKNPLMVHQAYFDPEGITKRFNLNLLARINRELGGNFQLDQFDFYSHYNPDNGEVKSYLVSLRPQTVYIGKLDKHFSFDRHEVIFTELSKKYSLQEIEEMAGETGFVVEKNFFDCQHYFVDSLWGIPTI
jgi:L-histidine Nalpha-methyltransferase